MSNPQLLAETDEKMIRDFNISKYFQYIFLNASGRGFGDRVRIN